MPLLACLMLLAVAPPAQATFHEMSIREVYPGGANDASYVELQMWAGGQNFVGTHRLVAYNPNGSVNEDFPLPSNVASGVNQATILVADTSYPLVFDEMPAPDASDADLNLSPAGGAVCWIEGSPPDCVAWGNFTGPLPAHVPTLKVGNPASPTGVTAAKALRRSIAAGCSTLLDPPPTDDSDDSATDFAEGEPNPRDNATAPTEKECHAPTVTIEEAPKAETNQTSASFKYQASSLGATFECKLETGVFEPCDAGGIEYTGIAEGKHTFQVRATDVNGTGLPTSYPWTVDKTPPVAKITSHPEDPSPGTSAAFAYESTEGKSSFECSLVAEGEVDDFSPCPLGKKTYPDPEHPAPLADGTWIFKVQATDPAGNPSTAEPFPAGTFKWTVDHLAGDKTPPETTIDSEPPDPSSSSTASFAYSSNESGSSFECMLDGSGFSPCSPTGISYAGLGNGPHAFQVRATDSSANTDQSPAGYSFEIALAGPSLTAPAPLPGPPPSTAITAKPAARTHDRTPTFRFRSTAAGVSFQCKVDHGPFKPCRSPYTTKSLSYGQHTLQVRATVAGVTDPSPAKWTFKVLKR